MGELVVLQGDQRRDHHGRTRPDHARELVDRRLAASRGQHGKGVPPRCRGGGSAQLPGPQPGEAEPLSGELLDYFVGSHSGLSLSRRRRGFRCPERRGRDSNPRGTKRPLPVFKTGAFNRSATPPARSLALGIGCRAMRALQITELGGPGSLKLVDIEEPGPQHMLAPDGGGIVDGEAAGVSFPEVLQSRGEYQLKPPLPFVPGSEVAGVVREAPEGADVKKGDRVAAMCMLGGFAEVAVAPPFLTFKLPDELDAAQGAGLVLNYHTAYFALKLRGRLEDGETVLVHGAAGGVGTASIQVANGLGARTIAVVSSDEKEQVAREAGADEVLRSDGPWKDQAKELSGGGVDVVLDPVGGDRFTDSLRSLGEGGRLVVVGFTGGSIPEVKVNRLLLNNTEVIGAGWGAYVMPKPDVNVEIGAEIERLVDSGHVRPVVGARFPLERAADALELIDGRGATGRVVLEL